MVSIVDSLVAPLSMINALVVALCLKCPQDVKKNLDAKIDFFNNNLYITCKKPGIGVITVKYIAGGDKVGGGNTTGGKLMEKEIVLVVRDANNNGGWL